MERNLLTVSQIKKINNFVSLLRKPINFHVLFERNYY